MVVMVEIRKDDLARLNKLLNNLTKTVKNTKTVREVSKQAVIVAKGNAPWWTGDTATHIALPVVGRNYARIISTSTDAKFPVKHLWINAVPGFERAHNSRKRYAEVARSGSPFGYWNVMERFIRDNYEKRLNLEIKRTLEGGTV